MTPTADALLAQLSLDAYSDAPVALPDGFTALDPSNFNMALAPGETFSEGIFHSGNAAALLSVGWVEGLATIVVAFRGSDDTTDSLQDLNGINAAYPAFSSLIAAVDTASEAWGAPVIVTGHSLGGAMAQLYMESHPNVAGEPGHAAVTFGSPGAVLAEGTDERITNYVIADDPAVVLGAHRAEIGELLRASPELADLAATQIAEELPGISKEQALASLPNLTVNYDNHGQIVLLPTADGGLDPESALAGLVKLDASRHDVDLYQAELPGATEPGGSVIIPEGPTTDPTLHAIFDGSGWDPDASRGVTEDLLRTWAEDRLGTLPAEVTDALDQIGSRLNDIGQDLQLV
ncbi:alpha/beta hydrolase family protein [Roseicella frigidaeris]|nr:DUF2974 domain-containing protein [Roseicella frigidaeris]